MIPPLDALPCAPPCIPRESGDDPLVGVDAVLLGEYSPRERG